MSAQRDRERARVLLVLLAVCAAGCATSSPASSPPASSAAAPDAGVGHREDSVEDVIARTHVAFVGQDGAFASANERWRATFAEGALHVRQPGSDGELAIRTGAITRDGWSCSDRDEAALDDGTIVRAACDGVREELVPSDEGVSMQWRFARAPGGQGDLVVRLDADRVERLERDASGGVRASAEQGAFAISRATWIDARGERTEIALEAIGSDAVVVRVPADVLARSAYPALLDPLIGPELSVDTPHLTIRGTGRGPSIAWNGAHFMVVFDEQVGGGARYVRALRIDPTGAVLDEFGIDVASTYNESFPHVVWTGTQWVVSYLTNDGAWSLRLARIAADGTLIDTAPFGTLGGLSSQFVGVELAMVGSTLFAVWLEASAGRLRRLDPTTLAFLDAAPIELCERPYTADVRLASDGTRAAVAWRGTGSELRTQIVSEDGTIGPILAPLPGVYVLTGIDVEWVGADIALGYQRSGGGIEVLRLAPDGTVIDAAPTVIHPTPRQSVVRLAWDGAALHAAFWTTAVPSGSTLLRGTVDWSGPTPVVSTTEIGRITLGFYASAIHAGGANVLAVWGGQQLLASRLDPAGTVLDGPGIPLHRSSSMQYVPALAWNGTHHVLAWRDDRGDAPGVYLLRVAADGVPVDALGVLAGVGDANAWPHLLVTGSTLHLVYREIDPSDGAYYLRARTVAPDLTLGPVHTLDLGATAASYSIAASATSIRVAFQLGIPHTRGFGIDHAPNGPAVPLGLGTGGVLVLRASRQGWGVATIVDRGSDGDVVVVRVRNDGLPIGTPIVLETVTRPTMHDMAGDPDGFFVTWGSSSSTRWMARVLDDGTIGFRTPLTSPAPRYALGFHGGMHLAHVWPASFDDRLAFVRTDGTTRAAFEIAAGRNISQAAASSEPGGRTLVAFRVFDPATPYRNARVRVRLLTPDAAMGTPCTSGASCESGLCVDGVCCDQTCGGGVVGDCVACSVARGAVANGTCSPLGASVTCRASRGVCDAEERCDGVAPACPADAAAVNGTPCPDAIVCNGAESCMAGACVAGAVPSCDLGDVCAAYSCVEPTGCVATPIPGCCRGDAECDDGDGCTIDRCVSRACERATAPACIDAGVDAGTDAGVDAGTDAGVDAGTDAGVDAGTDAGVDAGTDAGVDAGIDAGVDAGTDAGVDASIDAGDAGAPDADLDAGSSPLDAAVDAGELDAGELDAHVPDTDAMPLADASTAPVDAATAPGSTSGCSCRVAGRPAAPSWLGAAIAAIAILVPYRSSRRSRARTQSTRT